MTVTDTTAECSWAPGWGLRRWLVTLRRQLVHPVCRSACARDFSVFLQLCAHAACARASRREGIGSPLAPALLGSIIYCFVAPPKRQLWESAVGAPLGSVAPVSGTYRDGLPGHLSVEGPVQAAAGAALCGTPRVCQGHARASVPGSHPPVARGSSQALPREELPTGARWGAGAGRGRGRGPGALRLG